MKPTKIDLKDGTRYIKATSLMGQDGGPPSWVDTDENNQMVRIRPYNYEKDYKWEDLKPWKIEAHGKEFGPPSHSIMSHMGQSHKKRVYSNNRVRYPLKRVDWDPNGERNPQNRGKSRFVRISWDEAAQLIADELLRVNKQYGPEAVLVEADMHAEAKHIYPCHGCQARLLSLLGGYTVQMRNQDSWEGWFWGAKHVWGCEGVGEMTPMENLYPDICKNSTMLLFWGCDPETTPHAISGQMSTRLCYFFTEIGIKSVYVCPDFNYGAAVHGDKWLPVLPCTDAALLLAIIYTWLTEGTYEKEYVKTHTVGADEFFDYVLGKVDGVPKTPEWATEKCGVEVWDIKALARAWANNVTSYIIGNGGGNIRGPYASEPARLVAIALGMQGLGRPGVHQAKMIEWNLETRYGPIPYISDEYVRLPVFSNMVRPVDLRRQKYIPVSESIAKIVCDCMTQIDEENIVDGVPGPEIDIGSFATRSMTMAPNSEALLTLLSNHPNGPLQNIPRCLVGEAILNGHAEWWGLLTFCGPRSQQFLHFHYPAEGCSEVHMVWTDAPCNVTCWNDGYQFVRALRSPKIECVVAQHMWLENDCLLADIVLPIITQEEMADILEDAGSGVYQAQWRSYAASDPVGESVSDFEAVARVAKKLGDQYWEDYTLGRIYDYDEDKLIGLFYSGTELGTKVSYEEFKERGGFHIAKPSDAYEKIPAGMYNFYMDPEKNPINTPSGKLEFTSEALRTHFPGDVERAPYPTWVEAGEYHDERISSERAKKYPLLCMSNHGHWRMHAQCDDITWCREIDTMKIRAKDGYQYEPCWINPEDAKARGIEYGDIVKIFNERGTVLCAAFVTERLMPGAAYVDHGARFDPIDAECLDRGGTINLITPANPTSKHCCGMVVTGFLVDVQKVTDEEMEGWKKQYPDSFARKVDEGCGVCLDGWLIQD